MERKHIVMIILAVIFVLAVLDISWNKTEVFENFFEKVEMHEVTGGLHVDESTPAAKGDREFNLEGADIETLLINNLYGKIQVEGTKDDTIQLQVELTVYADEKELAEQVLEDLVIEKEMKATSVLFELEDNKVLPMGVRGIVSNFTIYVPERLSLDLRSYGDLRVNNVWGEVKLANLFGSSWVAGVHNNLKLYQRSGSSEIKDVEGNLELQVKFGGISIEDIQGEVKIDASHSKIDLNRIKGNVECDDSFGQVRAWQIEGDLVADLRHNPITVDGVSGRVDVDNAFGDVELTNVQKDVRVTNEHANIRIRTDYNHQVVAETEHGNMYIRGNTLKVEEDEHNRYMVKAKGTIGEGKYWMELENRFGNIDIQ